MSSRKLKIHSSNSTKSSAKSSAKSSTRSSPINFEDINLNEEKKIENVFELIDKLNPDMQREVFSKLLSYNPSNANSRKLSLVNNQFADVYSRTRRLSKINSPKNLTIEKLPEITNKVFNVIGDLQIKKILKYYPVVQELNNILEKSNYKNLYDKEGVAYLLNCKTLAKAKKHYEINTNKTDFNKIKKDYNDIWNFKHIDPYYSYLGRIISFQSKIKKSRKLISKYDPENVNADNQKIDSFLKMNPANTTYAEYIKAVQDLPLSVKILL